MTEANSGSSPTDDVHNSVVIDTLFVNGARCLPGEPQPVYDELAPEEMLNEHVSALVKRRCDMRWLKGELPSWSWWEDSGVDAIYTTIGISQGVSEREAYFHALNDIARWTMRFDKSPRLAKVTRAQDVASAKREGRYGIILGTQNLNCLNGDLDNIELFYKFGIRGMQLTYNLRNLAGNGCTERRDGGLSEFGIDAISRMNELGILVDLSHCGARTTTEAIKASKQPVAFTHTFPRAVHDHDRGKTDEALQALRDNGGYMGVLMVPDFLTSSDHPSVEHCLDHIAYVAELLGVERIGIGTDYGHYYPLQLRISNRKKLLEGLTERGVTSEGWRRGHFREHVLEVNGYRDWRDFHNIVSELHARGYTKSEIAGILGGNFLRFFQSVVG